MTNYDYNNLNVTELIELARCAGFLTAHRGIGREGLIDLLKGKAELDDFPANQVDDDRESMLMMRDEWPIILRQLPCASEHFACWDCPDGRVTQCVVLSWADELQKYRDDLRKGIKRKDWLTKGGRG